MSSRASVIQWTGLEMPGGQVLRIHLRIFQDPSVTRGGNCDIGYVACRPRSNANALGMHCDFNARPGGFRGAWIRVVVDRDKRFGP